MENDQLQPGQEGTDGNYENDGSAEQQQEEYDD